MDQIKLTLNILKAVYLTFGNLYDSVPLNIGIKINNVILTRDQQTKYLGIIFYYNMK